MKKVGISVVILIVVGLVTLLFIPASYDPVENIVEARIESDFHFIGIALAIYKKEAGRFPNESEGLDILVPEYLHTIPKDPWGKDYKYKLPKTVESQPILWTNGKDGNFGGEGENADVHSQL